MLAIQSSGHGPPPPSSLSSTTLLPASIQSIQTKQQQIECDENFYQKKKSNSNSLPLSIFDQYYSVLQSLKFSSNFIMSSSSTTILLFLVVGFVNCFCGRRHGAGSSYYCKFSLKHPSKSTLLIAASMIAAIMMMITSATAIASSSSQRSSQSSMMMSKSSSAKFGLYF
ncbi:hypothetical protein DERP_003808 [Dermatophagoides pteronyssinus]|uniref:Uncharacterized protein n=1 Tax=Dermatophagoides pteronyssinus TaxID=6956 RepID=A0ABQ8JM22_DERPT|nr:hypothetical protein DERP_003808 [Dermatophagoides pteronyssinus]